MMQTIPSCFFPTKVVLLDDNDMFLKELGDILDTTTATYQLFSNPYDVIPYVQKAAQKELYFTKYLKNNYDDFEKEAWTRWKQLYSSTRFECISTLIVDYMMPGLNGLEVCESLKNTSIQKIMLTGEADETIAINAFNEGIIQGFVRKDDPKVFQKLNSLIHKVQTEFFNLMTKSVLEKADSGFYGTVIRSPEFINIFESIRNKFHSIEYYLIDEVGKFILVDEMGNVSALYAYNQEELLRTPHMAAEGYFINGSDFTFPVVPVVHPLNDRINEVIGRIDGQENSPHHTFPIYKVPACEGYVWGYIPKLISVEKIETFGTYKQALS